MDGAYHGHADSLLVAAGSGAATLGLPGTAGVTEGAARDTLTVPWNDAAAIEAVFREHRSASGASEIAAVIIEPVCGNMGCVPPEPGYLELLRKLTADHGTILIFDEVMTGFRVALGGAQARYGITPDLTCLGKIVGGGLPAAAYGGRAEIMDQIAPLGPVYQAGTLSGNPLAVAAGQKLLSLLEEPGLYERLEQTSTYLASELLSLCQQAKLPAVVNQVGSMFTLFFTGQPVKNYADAKRSDTGRFARFFHGMLDRGIYLPPSQFEAAFVSAAHQRADLEKTLRAAREVLPTL
jgi:glutamate-1-semialdehyde 2,1-aminomutase